MWKIWKNLELEMLYVLLIILIIYLIIHIISIFHIIAKIYYPYRQDQIKEPFSKQQQQQEDLDLLILTPEKLMEQLREDADNYYATLTTADWHARGLKGATPSDNIIAYKQNSIDVACRGVILSDIERQRIERAVGLAQSFYADMPKIAKLPWVVGIVNGESYEGGLPHTRANCLIVIPYRLIRQEGVYDNDKLVKVLIHEKYHVYQKQYPDVCKHLIQDTLGFRPVGRNVEVDPLIRANPDTDGIVYMSPSGQILKCVYRSNKPHNILDCVDADDQRNEHPFELTAIQVENMAS